MNKEIKEMWVDALNSGVYEQNKGSLKTNEKYCCLGVLCDIYSNIKKGGEFKDNTFHIQHYSQSFLPPSPVIKWAEINEDITGRLSRLNDDGKSFSYIAKVIEKL